MNHNIKIDIDAKNQIFGTVDEYNFSIKIGNGEVLDNIAETKIGVGILQLSIYNSTNEIKGLMLPAKTTTMRTYAKYSEGEWVNLHPAVKEIVLDIIDYFDRRIMMRSKKYGKDD